MDKVLIKLYVPAIEEVYDVWFPLGKKVYNIINLLVKAVNEFSGGYYNPNKLPMLYDKATATQYNINLNVRDNDIKNGAEIIMI